MPKKCKTCSNQIDDRYEYCISCVQKVKQGNQNEELLKVLTQINWNLGTKIKQDRLYYLFRMIMETNLLDNKKQIEIVTKIMDYFTQDLDKDFKQLKHIKEEQGK